MHSEPKTDGTGPKSGNLGQRLSMSRERTSSMSGTTTLAAPPPVSPRPAYKSSPPTAKLKQMIGSTKERRKAISQE